MESGSVPPRPRSAAPKRMWAARWGVPELREEVLAEDDASSALPEDASICSENAASADNEDEGGML
eukprot:11615365-Prorocentrum_lima.AAC.1